jgi:syntaxin 5
MLTGYLSSELTFVIKQSLSKLNQDLSGLQSISKQASKNQQDQVSKHNDGVVVLLRTRLGDVTSR